MEFYFPHHVVEVIIILHVEVDIKNTNPLDWGFFISYLYGMKKNTMLGMAIANGLVLLIYSMSSNHIETYRWVFTIFFFIFFIREYVSEKNNN